MQNEKKQSLVGEWLKWMSKKELALILILSISTFFLVLFFSSTANAFSARVKPLKIADGSFPALSGSGKIAYVSTKSGESELYVYFPDEHREVRLTSDIHAEFEPSFYDEENIIYISLASGKREIWKVNLRTLEREQLTKDGLPKYSPKANRKGEIAYVAGFYPRVDIYIWKNGIVKRITSDGKEKYSIAWHDNGDKLAFIARDGKSFSIFIISLKDKSIEKIAENVYYRGLAFGENKVVFVRRANNGYDIYEKDLSSNEEKLILSGVSDSWEIDPSLTKKMLAFSTDENGRYEIYTIPLPQQKASENKNKEKATISLISEQPIPGEALSISANPNAGAQHEQKTSERESEKEVRDESEIRLPEKEYENTGDEIFVSKDEEEKESMVLTETVSKPEKSVKKQANTIKSHKIRDEQERWFILILLSAFSFSLFSYLKKKEKEKSISFA